MKHLPHVRRFFAVAVLLCFVIGAAGVLPTDSVLLWEEKGQWVPAFLAAIRGGWVGCAFLAFWCVVTLLMGRVYCSWFCPLGIMQDMVSRLRCLCRNKSRRGKYRRNHPWLRTAVALGTFVPFLFGVNVVLAWLDPYTTSVLGLRAVLFPTQYTLWALGFIAVSIGLPLLMSLFFNRLYCNTICPVGAVLGALAHRAPLAPRIQKEVCLRCGACMRACKADAIDVKTGQVDKSRCVGCYDCVGVCAHDALQLLPKRRKEVTPTPKTEEDEVPDKGRRALLGIGLFGIASAALPASAQEMPTGERKNAASAAVPAGAGDVESFISHCTGCGLCLSHCPTGVLQPAWLVHGWQGMMKPYLSYGEGDVYCRYDCRACSSVCPTGALSPLSLEQKQRTRVAIVSHNASNCIPWRREESCGRCAEACPTGALSLRIVTVPHIIEESCRGCRRCARVCPQEAITMVEVPGRTKKLAVVDYQKCIGCGACATSCRPGALVSHRTEVPVLLEKRCIGCGACYAACPARPHRALSMQPLAHHEEADVSEK